jgi:hypothetical protein
MNDKHLCTALKFVLLFGCLCAIPGCKRKLPVMGTGDEWRSWSAAERRQYLVGYLEGQLAAVYKTCHLSDDFAEQDGQTLYPNHFPSRRCTDAAPKYSKARVDFADESTGKGRSLDVSVYTNVLDTFYSHRECRIMPYEIILQHLNDQEFKSGDDLYKFVRSGPGWGAFSGFDGIEKCLPGYR